jgi:hypothetical protein
MKTILLLCANPRKDPELLLAQEIREIQVGLERSKHRDSFTFEFNTAVRVRDIHRAILDLDLNIVHFSGDGEEAGLVCEDESGGVKLVTGEALAELFKLFKPVECVILNACSSTVQAEAIAKYIPYVISMDGRIDSLAAVEFSIGFYDALGAGRDYEFAYKVGCNAINLAGLSGHLTPKLFHEVKLKPEEEKKEMVIDLLKLKRTLRSLIVSDLNDLIDLLNLPAGMIPPTSAEATSRVDKLLDWARSPTGCGLSGVQEALDEILNPR